MPVEVEWVPNTVKPLSQALYTQDGQQNALQHRVLLGIRTLNLLSSSSDKASLLARSQGQCCPLLNHPVPTAAQALLCGICTWNPQGFYGILLQQR